jgi:hypothetical protein
MNFRRVGNFSRSQALKRGKAIADQAWKCRIRGVLEPILGVEGGSMNGGSMNEKELLEQVAAAEAEPGVGDVLRLYGEAEAAYVEATSAVPEAWTETTTSTTSFPTR